MMRMSDMVSAIVPDFPPDRSESPVFPFFVPPTQILHRRRATILFDKETGVESLVAFYLFQPAPAPVL